MHNRYRVYTDPYSPTQTDERTWGQIIADQDKWRELQAAVDKLGRTIDILTSSRGRFLK